MPIKGLHHVHLICGAAEQTAQFYSQVLGLVSIAPPAGADHCLTDASKRSGTSLQFSVRPGDPQGRRGIGATHHVAFCVPDQVALRKWKRRLVDLGINVQGPYERKYFQSIYFKDPDGVILELATHGPGWTADESVDQLGTKVQTPPSPYIIGQRDEGAISADTWPDPVPEITLDFALGGFHHVTAVCSDIKQTHQFYHDLLGLRLVKQTYNFDNPRVPHWYWGPGQGEPGTVITYFGEGDIGTKRGQLGRGLTHHIAFAVEDQGELDFLHSRLVQAGAAVSVELENGSIRFHDPDGHILEVTC